MEGMQASLSPTPSSSMSEDSCRAMLQTEALGFSGLFCFWNFLHCTFIPPLCFLPAFVSVIFLDTTQIFCLKSWQLKVVHKILWRAWGHEGMQITYKCTRCFALKNHWLRGLWAAAVFPTRRMQSSLSPTSKWLFSCDQCLLPKSTNPCLLLCRIDHSLVFPASS